MQTEPPDRKLPARTVYRPWFSPYSFFIGTRGATQQHLSSLFDGTLEPVERDDLSDILSSSAGSLDTPQPPKKDQQASSRTSITSQDILTASRQLPVPQNGYKCLSCCRLFPALWLVKNHIRHSSQEGYSCKVFYRRLKPMRGRKRREQEAAAPVASV